MKVAVFGAGGIGGLLGGRLARAGVDVHLVARGAHLAALREDGLRVESVDGDFSVDLPATDDPADVGPCDYVLFTVKSYDTAEAAGSLGPLVGEGTAVISLQNGVDNEPALAEAVGPEHVMGGVAYVFSTIGAPGVVEHPGGPDRYVIGELDGRESERARAFVAQCEAAGIDVELSGDVRREVWEKTAFICAQSGMTAAVRLPLEEIRSEPTAWAMYRDVVEEACAVAVADGVDLPDDTVDRWVEFAAGLDGEMYSSLHYDLTHGKRMELEGLHGAVRRRAADHDVDVPMMDALYGVLKPWANRNG